MTKTFFILHELRLTTADLASRVRATARLASMPRAKDEQLLPMLVSIDDRHDVACLRRVQALPGSGDDTGERIHAALSPELQSGGRPRFYKERAALADGPGEPSYYRMAVTEGGTNDQAHTFGDQPQPTRDLPRDPRPNEAGEGELLWIGTPLTSPTGLLVITGHQDATAYVDGDPSRWPLPTSRELGVRIYESARESAKTSAGT